jgi:tetratricopeptide (TPR) repeat protein
VLDQPSSAFISYCRADEEFALRLAQDLKDAGAAVWLDQLDIKPGHSWDNAVEGALRAATKMLVILTPTSVSSENVRDEIAYALKQGKVVIPVLYIECEIPLRLERKQHIDFRANYTRGVDLLLRELRVDDPDKIVLERAAEAEAKRRRLEEQATQEQAREAEANRRRLEEQVRQEQARRAREETLRREQEPERQVAPPQPEPGTPRPQEGELRSDVKTGAFKPWLWRRSSWTGLAGGFAAVLILGFVIFRQAPSSHPDTASQTQPVAAQPAPQQAIPQPSVAAPPSPSPSGTTAQPSPTRESKPAPESKPDFTALAAQGETLSNSKRYEEALPLLKRACDGGNASGCNNLGFLYDFGRGVKQDYGKAFTFYTKACDGGDAFGCANLGFSYENGTGVAQDYGKSFTLYTKACKLENPDGCSLLGNLYRTGNGVAVNPELARQYLKKGCDMGNSWGCDRLKEMK